MSLAYTYVFNMEIIGVAIYSTDYSKGNKLIFNLKNGFHGRKSFFIIISGVETL